MRRLHFEKKEMREHLLEFIQELEEMGLSEAEVNKRVGEYYTNRVIRKYSREEQDQNWNEIYHTIMEVPGGYWQIVDNMDYMPEFEHYRFRCLKSAFGHKKPKRL